MDQAEGPNVVAASTSAAANTSEATVKANGKGIRQARNDTRGVSASDALRRRLTHIPTKQPVLLRLPSGKLKSVELHPGKTVSLGKFGSFRTDDIIGLPYGLTYEIIPTKEQEEEEAAAPQSKGKGKANNRGDQPPGCLQIVINRTLAELEETEATNEMINDDHAAQTLTYLDIQALKEAGLQGREIVQREVESNSSFQQRTAWSQQKFVMRKESKHLQLFTPVPPSLSNMFLYFNDKFDRDTDKLRGLRIDALANMLSLAGVAPGGKYLVVDGVGGAVAGAMLERMGGEGRLLALNDSDSPPAFDLMIQMGLPPSVVQPVLRSTHWACTEKNWEPILQLDGTEEVTPTGKVANDRDKQRFRKRRAQYLEVERTRQDLFEGDFDGLVIASQYDCVSIIDRLLPYLGGSSQIVVHHPYLQPITEAHAQLRSYRTLINISVSEPFLRKYQVLPGRMHPEMNTSSTAGYILHAIRVLSDEETRATVEGAAAANSIKAAEEEEPSSKRQKVDEAGEIVNVEQNTKETAGTQQLE